jgi:3-hydroxymyristoyl/3-hydroxydecanoyl-(acyl carrier protein) dehydratase
MYRRFDGPRRVARLPGPPYHFMSRVLQLDGPFGVCEPGASTVIEYSPPPGAWYFERNGYAAMPFAVLLEVVLQPCGWLASYMGSALTSAADLAFRNLDGSGTIYAEVLPGQGPLRTRTTCKSIAHSAGMILESFELECHLGETLVARLETGFGFFPEAALEHQVGLEAGRQELLLLDAAANLNVDLTTRPARYFAGSARLATGMLSMLDRVTAFDPKGGHAGRGSLRAEKDVRAEDWFFKAHFFQDPVQPGSLGLEAMLQLLQFYLLHQGLGSELVRPRFQLLAPGRPLTWKYRGQVTPSHHRITITLEVTESRARRFGSLRDRRRLLVGRAQTHLPGDGLGRAPGRRAGRGGERRARCLSERSCAPASARSLVARSRRLLGPRLRHLRTRGAAAVLRADRTLRSLPGDRRRRGPPPRLPAPRLVSRQPSSSSRVHAICDRRLQLRARADPGPGQDRETGSTGSSC